MGRHPTSGNPAILLLRTTTTINNNNTAILLLRTTTTIKNNNTAILLLRTTTTINDNNFATLFLRRHLAPVLQTPLYRTLLMLECRFFGGNATVPLLGRESYSFRRYPVFWG